VALSISAIIPAFEEAGLIQPLIKHLHGKEGVQEVLVVDGGSHDGTVCEAEQGGARVITVGKKGRASQMNAGAAEATGDILYFVHADAWPPASFAADVISEVLNGYLAGCFRSRFNTKNKFLLANSFFTRFRGIIFRGGGQTLFITKPLFEALGGYTEAVLVMEEYDLIQRIQQHHKFCVIPKNVIVSARKYQKKGRIRLQFSYALIFLLFLLRFPQKHMISVYKRLID